MNKSLLPDNDPSAVQTSAPTRVRYAVLGYLCALTFVLYLDRVCIGQAVVAIEEELDISDDAMGYVLAAFIIAYGLFEVPTGRWGDRYGSRGVLVRIVLWWSAFTALTGAATGFVMLLIVRFLFGAGEAGALPNAARVLKRWFPPGALGRAQGSLTTFMLLGGVLAPVAAQRLINLVGWRWSFVVFGGVGVFWALAFYSWFRDDPAQHPSVNRAELDVIGAGVAPSSAGEAHPPIPWRLALTSANIWLMSGVILCATFVAYLYFSWYPTYLKKARAVDPDLASELTSLVLAGGALGCVCGGYIGDWLLRRMGSRRWSRRITASGGFAVSAVALLASIKCDSPVAAALCTSLAFFSANIQLATWWVTASEISGKHVGALFGLMNSVGAIGGLFSNLFPGTLSTWLKSQGYEGRAQWDPAFYMYSGMLVLGAIGWLFIDASKQVEEPEKPHTLAT